MPPAFFRIVLLVSLVAAALTTATARAQKAPAPPPAPDTVIFEPNVEYANPDGQHLQLHLARSSHPCPINLP